jgi:Nucleotidyl transferase AbiEii toxin, Type IV TA system
MGSDPILAVELDIDDQIIDFCRTHPTVAPEDVLRDIARIVCIANLVRNGTLDGTTMVLCGGMAMRCLESPRMSVYDGDAASRTPLDPDDLRLAITYDEPEIAIAAGPLQAGKDLITFQPVSYTARFSELPTAQDEFSLSFAHRGIELQSIKRPLRHRYPFPLLREEIEVPIMNPEEILAEKVVAWWLFGHAKHYNDIAFLGLLLAAAKQHQDPAVRRRVRAVIETKLAVNTGISDRHRLRVEALIPAERERRLTDPHGHVDPRRDFDTLSFLLGGRPLMTNTKASVDRCIVPLLFD